MGASLPCYWCVPPDAIISGSFKPIAEISHHESLYGLEGTHDNVVNKIFARDYNGELVAIKAVGTMPIKTTPEHNILVAKVRKRHVKSFTKSSRTNVYVNDIEFMWTPAGEISKAIAGKTRKEKFCLVIPRIKGSFFAKEIDLSSFTSEHGKKTALAMGYPIHFPLSRETAWLLGLYVAEGHVNDSHVYFSLGKHEKELQHRLCEVIKKLGYKPYIFEARTTNEVSISSRLMARAFSSWCGRHAVEKRIPNFIMDNADIEIITSFLQGYFEGDGCLHQRRRTLVAVATTSKTLALQLQLLLARLGILASIYINGEKTSVIDGRIVKGGTSYALHITHPKAVELLGATKKVTRTRYIITDKHILAPILKIHKEPYNGPVFNLETKDNTYLVHNIIVHNCEWAKKHVRLKPQATTAKSQVATTNARASTNPSKSSLTVEEARALGVQAANFAFNWQLNIFKVVLVAVFLFANAMDYYTTKKGLEAGLKEGNIFAKTIMKWGWKKYQAVKLIGPALFAYQALTSEDPNYIWTASLAVGAAMFTYAFVQNLMLLMGRKTE